MHNTTVEAMRSKDSPLSRMTFFRWGPLHTNQTINKQVCIHESTVAWDWAGAVMPENHEKSEVISDRPTDRQTDRQTDIVNYRVALTRLIRTIQLPLRIRTSKAGKRILSLIPLSTCCCSFKERNTANYTAEHLCKETFIQWQRFIL